MKKSTKLLSLLLALSMLFALAACGTNGTGEESSTGAAQSSSPVAQNVTLNVAALKGPTGIGMVKLMKDAKDGTTANKYNFTLAGAPDEITAKFASGEFDIAAVPVNLAAALYNKTKGNAQVMAINTLGVLYILENGNSIHSIADLKGKTIYATGKGATPEYILNYLLEQNGIDPAKDVTIEYKNEHAELATLMASNKAAICMLPEPNVTSVLRENKEIRRALNLTTEWDKATEKSGEKSTLAQGCQQGIRAEKQGRGGSIPYGIQGLC